MILQKQCAIGPDDTLGDVYFNHLFPLGVQAMLEAADSVFEGRHSETVQEDSKASYEGWCRAAESKIHWANHIDAVYNVIRGCNPAPGAWAMLNGKKVQIFDVRKNLFRRFADVVGKVGEISSINDKSFSVTAQGGTIEVLRIRGEDGKKLSGGEFAIAQGLTNGIFFDV